MQCVLAGGSNNPIPPQALRIALQCVESHANRYGRYIEPLLSVSADFYIRLFLRIHTSAARVKLSARSVREVRHLGR